MEKLKDELETIFLREFANVKRRLELIEPACSLLPINSPQRSRDFVRDPNVTALMREKIEEANRVVPFGAAKYVQFHPDVSVKRLNTDAKDALEKLRGLKMGTNFGAQPWCKNPRDPNFPVCEAVIRVAAASTDFAVFRQSANLWCIRDLAEKKHKYVAQSLAVANPVYVDETQNDNVEANGSEVLQEHADETSPEPLPVIPDSLSTPTALRALGSSARGRRKRNANLGAARTISRGPGRRSGVGRGRSRERSAIRGGTSAPPRRSWVQ